MEPCPQNVGTFQVGEFESHIYIYIYRERDRYIRAYNMYNYIHSITIRVSVSISYNCLNIILCLCVHFVELVSFLLPMESLLLVVAWPSSWYLRGLAESDTGSTGIIHTNGFMFFLMQIVCQSKTMIWNDMYMICAARACCGCTLCASPW